MQCALQFSKNLLCLQSITNMSSTDRVDGFASLPLMSRLGHIASTWNRQIHETSVTVKLRGRWSKGSVGLSSAQRAIL
jgi:hypothetical protein